MKKKIYLAAFFVLLSMTSGCLLDTHKLTDQEMDIIAEYAADALLRHDNYQEALLSPTPTPTLTPTPTPESTPTPTQKPQVTGQPDDGRNPSGDKIQASLTEVFGLEGLCVDYDGFETAESYSDPSISYALNASEGMQWVKVKLKLTNTAGILQSFRFADLNVIYQLDCGMKYFLKPKLTLLTNDLTILESDIQAGESISCFLLFEAEKDVDFSKANFIVSRDDRAAIIRLQ